MVFIDSFNQKYFLVSFQNKIHLYDLEKNSIIYSLNHTNQIVVAKYLINKNLLIYSDSLKIIFIDDLSSGINIAKKILSKRAVKILCTKDESKLLIADKSGDVYILDLNNILNSDLSLLMGHISSLLDVSLDENENYLFTADRDEKIRCSYFPNSYNIDSYFLGHEEFIRQIQFIRNNVLLSASGDGYLFLWDLNTKKTIQKLNLNDLFEKSQIENYKNIKNLGVYKFVYNKLTNELFVNLFKTNFLMYFKYDFDSNSLEYKKIIELNSMIHDFINLKQSIYLFIYPLNSNNNFVEIKKFENNEFKDIDEMNYFKNEIIKMEDLRKNLDNEIKETNMNYLSFYKNTVDNMSEYFTRKEKRISQKRKHSETNSISSN